MTTILLDLVLVETREKDTASIVVPPSAKAVGMAIEEFRYITRSAVQGFGQSM